MSWKKLHESLRRVSNRQGARIQDLERDIRDRDAQIRVLEGEIASLESSISVVQERNATLSTDRAELFDCLVVAHPGLRFPKHYDASPKARNAAYWAELRINARPENVAPVVVACQFEFICGARPMFAAQDEVEAS